jgi:histidinol-phosphate aminotransferase
MKKFVRDNIDKIKPYKPGKPIEDVKRELGLSDIVKLASNENPLGVSPKALLAMQESLKEIYRYPDGSTLRLRRKLADKFNIDMDNLIIGNGSNEIIELAIRAFLYEHEEVITSTPDFLIFKLATLQEAGKVIEVPLDNFYCDLNKVYETITDKTKIIFISNPNNPVGTYINEEALSEFIEKTPENIIIFLDEAYCEFAQNIRDFPKSLRYLKKPNVIITRTFSKAYGLSGIRVGYAMSNKKLIEAMNKARQPFNVNMVAQAGAEAALDDDDFLGKTIKSNEAGKIYIYNELNELGLDYVPSATNFILINTKRDAENVFDEMLKRGVIIRSMAAYRLNNWIRVTIGKEEENRKFISALKDIIKGDKT